MANTTDTELASINSDMAVACKLSTFMALGVHFIQYYTFLFFPGEIKYDDKITEEDGVYIQAAILFTSCSGQRRLRVVNLSLNTGSSMAEMYRNCKLLKNTQFSKR